jgi:hypothetical protein
VLTLGVCVPQTELLEHVLGLGVADLSEINYRALSERFQLPASILKQRLWRQVSFVRDHSLKPLDG